MACCFLFCSDEPVDNDKYGAHPNFFQVKLKDAACRDPGCCMPACILWPCALYKTRTLVLVRLASGVIRSTCVGKRTGDAPQCGGAAALPPDDASAARRSTAPASRVRRTRI